MRLSKNALLTILLYLLILASLPLAVTSQMFGRFSLGILFTVLLWQRTEQSLSRWLAVLILWTGLLVAWLWNWFSN